MAEWQVAFRAAAPGLDVRWWDDPTVDPGTVLCVLCWEPEPGRLAGYPNLRLICSSGAGVDHITRDPFLPRDVLLVRMGGAETARQMAEYVAMATLFLLRGMRRVITAQAAQQWDDTIPPRLAQDTKAGVLGLGNLGAPAAMLLRDIGFPTAGWSRAPKTIPGVESFAGSAALGDFLARTEILVCLLPQTAATHGLIDAARMALLPRGAAIINAGRGSQVVLPDLIAALDSGHLAGAILDVFETEPLPADHPAWTHPGITITPHIASLPSRIARAAFVAQSIAAFERGEELPNRYDPIQGY